MNVLMVTNTFLPHVGGVANSVASFAGEYRRQGHRVLVVAPRFRGAPPGEKAIAFPDTVQGVTFGPRDLGVALALAATGMVYTARLGVGACMVVNSAVINSMLQAASPDHLRGRVVAIYVAVYIGTNPIGSTVSGYIARLWGTPLAIGGMAAIMGVYALWAIRRYPELRHAT